MSFAPQLLERIAKDVKKREIRGLGVSMLKNCRQFYRFSPQIRQSVPDVLSIPFIGAIRQSLIGESDQPPAKTISSDSAPVPLAPDQLLRLSGTQVPRELQAGEMLGRDGVGNPDGLKK